MTESKLQTHAPEIWVEMSCRMNNGINQASTTKKMGQEYRKQIVVSRPTSRTFL